MLFNSPQFVFGFLPATLVCFYIVGRFSRPAAALVLVVASLYFYAQWHYRSLYLLCASIAFNHLVGKGLAASWDRAQREGWRKGLLIGGIVANLGCLAYFKYWRFLAETANDVLSTHFAISHIALPLGISFFTFTQIAYLVDVYERKAREGKALHYALFVTYFPHLIAGPIIHHSEVMPQFGRASTYRLSAENLAVGLTIFVIGLFKKVVLADGVAPYVHTAFDGPGRMIALAGSDAWLGAVFYGLQIYFDFSGYSDMAIGLSRMFGIHLPLNFNSPYKAVDIIDFWRRWHMTLSRFLRDYLYIPLGGNRFGAARRLLNVMIVMLLGGLWHGAGWTYVIWGALHGIFLVGNHVWRLYFGELKGPRLIGRLATFGLVTVAWVFFRAPDVSTALGILKSMAGMTTAPAGPVLLEPMSLVKLAALLTIAWFFPNTQEFMDRVNPALGYTGRDRRARFLTWRPSWPSASMLAVLTAWSFATMFYSRRIAEFIYFQF
jgi:alginate O-acetyltransferase complex protein AlgI